LSIIGELRRRNVLRVAAAYLAVAWLLIQLVNEISPLLGWTEAVGRTVLIVLAIGFVPALIVSWVFELTPEGLKRDSALDRSAPTDRRATRRFDRAIMVVLSLAVVLFAFDRFVLDPARDEANIRAATERGRSEARLESFGDKSIVVLPFRDMSEGGDQEYFSDGMTEELLNLLSRIEDLRVIARTSAFSFKGKDTRVPEIAEQLDVTYVLRFGPEIGRSAQGNGAIDRWTHRHPPLVRDVHTRVRR
jgi:adenylate cyclase